MIRIHRVVTLGLALGALTACGSQAPAPVASTPAAPPAPKVLEPTAVVKWYQDCWEDFNERKFDALRACYAADAQSRQIGGNPVEVNGAADISTAAQQFAAQFPDLRGTQQLILVHGKRLASISVLNGTQSGPLLGADGKTRKATGRKLGLWFAHAVDVAADPLQVVREYSVRDSGSMELQLGLSKGPGRALIAAPTAPPVIAITSESATESQNVATETAAIEAWNRHDAAACEATQADEVVVHDATYARDMDKAQNTADNKKYWAGFSNAMISYRTLWAAGDYVVYEGRFTGTNDGKMPGMAKTGRKVAVPMLQIDRFEGGKVRETWLFYDSGNFMAQLMGKAPAT